MDSTAYKYFVEQRARERHAELGALPLQFTFLQGTEQRFDARPIVEFLRDLTISDILGFSEITDDANGTTSPFLFLFVEAHKAIADVLSGADAEAHPFRVDGMQLARFLVFCAGSGCALFPNDNFASWCAMACFLCEGLMHVNWCPNAFEAEAKRAAHSYFIAMKKSLGRTSSPATPSMLGHVWSAWLLSRKTEGIRSSTNSPTYEWLSESFTWRTRIGRASYCAVKRESIGLFYMLVHDNNVIAHPFADLCKNHYGGMKLRADNDPVEPISLVECREIKRRTMSGHKFIYMCKSGSKSEISWSVVVLNYENTIYRLDIISFAPQTRPVACTAELRLACPVTPKACGKNSFISGGAENTVIRFPDSPMEFLLARVEKDGTSVFGSSIHLVDTTLRIVTAWASGRGISAINDTVLLGLYE